MQFQGALQITNGVAMIDPIATPGSVPSAQILVVPARGLGDAVRTTFLALDAPAAEGVTVTVFAVDEATIPKAAVDDPNLQALLDARRFYALQSGIAVAGGALVALTTPIGGALYIRRTADTLTVPRFLRVGVQ